MPASLEHRDRVFFASIAKELQQIRESQQRTELFLAVIASALSGSRKAPAHGAIEIHDKATA